ncbi:MAG: hypothetical protein O2967_07695 [Proteobacteria bacterium]|nr:hypothetical protein [Pseudomonadota bacterium]
MLRYMAHLVLAVGMTAPFAAALAQDTAPAVDLVLVAEGLSAPLLLVEPPAASWRALWPIEIPKRPDVRLHGLGEDADGELYLMTTAQGIPVGNSGEVWKPAPTKD